MNPAVMVIYKPVNSVQNDLTLHYRRDRIITRAGGKIYSEALKSCKSNAIVQLK